jgi:hypothetical protein
MAAVWWGLELAGGAIDTQIDIKMSDLLRKAKSKLRRKAKRLPT